MNRTVLALILVGLLLVVSVLFFRACGSSDTGTSDLEARIDALQAENETLARQRDSLRTGITARNDSIQTLSAAIAALQTERDASSRDLRRALTQLRNYRDEPAPRFTGTDEMLRAELDSLVRLRLLTRTALR